jgi:hypothetical protein
MKRDECVEKRAMPKTSSRHIGVLALSNKIEISIFHFNKNFSKLKVLFYALTLEHETRKRIPNSHYGFSDDRGSSN